MSDIEWNEALYNVSLSLNCFRTDNRIAGLEMGYEVMNNTPYDMKFQKKTKISTFRRLAEIKHELVLKNV